jgi:tetratricopeptide (TPR) repeat protein
LDEFQTTWQVVRDRLDRFAYKHAVAQEDDAASVEVSHALRLVDEQHTDPFPVVKATDAASLAWYQLLAIGTQGHASPSTEHLSELIAEIANAAALRPWILEATGQQPPDFRNRDVHLDLVGAVIGQIRRAAATGSIDASVFALANAASTTPSDDQNYGRLCSCLGLALNERYKQTKLASDAAWWIWATTEALRVPPPGLQAEYLRRCGVAHGERFELIGDQADLGLALSSLRASCAITDIAMQPRPYLDLGITLVTAYQLGGDASNLDEAVQVLQQLLAHEPTPVAQRTRLYNGLASALYLRFGTAGALVDLDDAISLYRSAVETQNDPMVRALYLANLGGVLAIRFQQMGLETDLEDGLTALRESLRDTPAGSEMRAERLDSYGVALQIAFRQTADVETLGESITVLREAVHLADPGSTGISALRNLAGGLEARFDSLGQQSDLDEAIVAYRKIMASVSESDHDLPVYLLDMGNVLSSRYSYYGDIRDLDDGIGFLRQGLDHIPVGDSERCIALHALGVNLAERFGHMGGRPDLDEAEELLRAAVAVTPPGHAFRPVHLESLARCLQTRFELEHDPWLIDEAVMLHEQVSAANMSGVSGATALTNLGGALITRYRSQNAPADLRRAIAAYEGSVAAAGPGYPNLCLYRANLGEALTISAQDTQQAQHADAAVAVLTAAADDAGENHPRSALILTFLARAFAARAELTGATDDRQQALRTWRAASRISTAPPGNRLSAAAEWAAYAGKIGDDAEALTACSAAVHLLSLVAWRGLRRQDQERLIGESHGVTADAVAWSLNTGNPTQAIELAEEGRSVLWSQMLETRGDLTAVHAAYPAIAADLERVRRGLQQDKVMDDVFDEGDEDDKR